MSLRPQRTRRTKVYDCNYDIGQRYYKPVVDDLDRKYSGRTSADSPGSGLGSLRSALEEAESSLGSSSARRAAREASAEELEESTTLNRTCYQANHATRSWHSYDEYAFSMSDGPLTFTHEPCLTREEE
ncbi:Uncharacterized protein GBIM_10830 [Gryllus bimaculatus]|nr:Uncharacterized protein GBIM_10830 [Gryllus bimaculatus]